MLFFINMTLFHKIYWVIDLNSEIEKRVLDEAYKILKTDRTIREVAQEFGVSKSTVHKDMHDRLKDIDDEIYKRVNQIMQNNIEIRHIRGGESTRKKYQKLEKIVNLSTNIK